MNSAREDFSITRFIKIMKDCRQQLVVDVINGNTATAVSDRSLHAFFLVLSEGSGQFSMNMRSQVLDFDTSTPSLGMNTIVNENLTPYIDTKQPDQSGNDTSEWKTFRFNISRSCVSPFSKKKFAT